MNTEVTNSETATENLATVDTVSTQPEEKVIVKEDTTKIVELEKIIESMKAENEALKNEVSTYSSKTKEYETTITELTGIKAEFETISDKATQYENTIKGLVDSKIEKVPEAYRGLVPKGANMLETLEWLNQAEGTGLFGARNIEIGKPMNPVQHKDHIDTSNMSPTTLMAMAYGSKK